MKHIILAILTILVLCGTVHSNPIEALENELESIRPTLHEKGLDELKRFNKLRSILRSMKQQEKDAEVIRQWEEDMANEPCTSMFRQECDGGVRI